MPAVVYLFRLRHAVPASDAVRPAFGPAVPDVAVQVGAGSVLAGFPDYLAVSLYPLA